MYVYIYIYIYIYMYARNICRMCSVNLEQVIAKLIILPKLANRCMSRVTKSSALQTCILAQGVLSL